MQLTLRDDVAAAVVLVFILLPLQFGALLRKILYAGVFMSYAYAVVWGKFSTTTKITSPTYVRLYCL